ncbi:SDR family oxidoreductase [Erythrobacter sp.]|uniref:SDR family oxidoreductase n=1 Tax=Erythrobacter sp. TaxID=1042 RepID=UPI001425BDE1|nr:SDR family oxidoreductase [Erythrobacter sp.]QIQ87773.1 MAG: SDR family oxidoreductase [Erythrobacter sp.]
MTQQQQGSSQATFIEPIAEEPDLPGHESALERKPEWQPRYPGSGRMKDKVAIVTGGDSGIGRATAVLFAREGADIAISYLEEHDDATKTKELCEAEGAEVLTIAGDLGAPGEAQKLVDAVMERFSRIDSVIQIAGEQHPDYDVTDITPEQLQRTFQSNIFSMFYVAQAARPHLKEGATIVNCTSVTMYKGAPILLDYSATKGAITAFTRSLSGNLVDDGIRVNAVAPGPIWTPLNPCGGMPEEEMDDWGTGVPMGRPGEPNEVAPAFLFLACEDSSYMSGQVLHPNGGSVVSG